MKYNLKYNEFVDFIKTVYKEKYNFDDKLNNFHEILDSDLVSKVDLAFNQEIRELGVDDRKSIFIKDYHRFVDENLKAFNDIYFKFICDHIKPLFPEDKYIVVQKTPNLRISFPNLTAIGKHKANTNMEVIGLHKDGDFGHHKDEINYIIPITEMFETNSLYYEPFANSNYSTDDYLNLSMNENEYFVGKLNNILHYNKINKTGFTRISLDFRIIPYENYLENIEFFTNSKFEIGKYYSLYLNI